MIQWYDVVLMVALAGVALVFLLIAIGGVVMIKQNKANGGRVLAWAMFMIIIMLAMAARMGAG